MPQCPQCKAELPADSASCQICGAPIQLTPTHDLPPTTQPPAPQPAPNDQPSTAETPTPAEQTAPPATPSTDSLPRRSSRSAQPARPPRRRRVWLWLLLAGVLVLAGVGTVLVLGPRFLGGSVDGTLVSLTRQAPISGAEIHVRGQTVTTDSHGRFYLQNLPLGSVPVTVTATGFKPFASTLQVKAFSTTSKRLVLRDASLTVTLREIVASPKPVTGASVRVAGTAVLQNADGAYAVSGLPVGQMTVVASADGCEAAETTVSLSAGENTATVTLHLTPKATCLRYYQAFEDQDWKAAYAYLHPDVARREPYKTFVKDMKAWGTPESLDITEVTMLRRWTSSAGKTYRNVAEISRSLTGKNARGASYSNKGKQHWVNVNGMWFRVDV